MLHIQIEKVWSNTIVLWFFSSDRFRWNEVLRIHYGFETRLIAWPLCFVRHFLWTTVNSSWTLSQISKGGVFSFLCLCSNVYIAYKTNVVEGWLLLGFNNAFAFALYSRMFPPFARCTSSITFLSGGYNFNLRGFPLKFTALSHPFFWCSLILIFKFFL
jgi:hypothetical protein